MSDYPMLISNKLHSFRNFIKHIIGLCFDMYSLCREILFPFMGHWP